MYCAGSQIDVGGWIGCEKEEEVQAKGGEGVSGN
jgi:hypothetical protein